MLDPPNWTLPFPLFAAALALGYVFGSIPFGVLVTRLAGTQDLRTIGSGNIGATNVLRTGRKGLAAATLLGDALKGTAAVFLAYHFWGNEGALLAGLGAFLGHLFPIWLGFKGGKGVATYIGVLLAFSWPATLIYGAIWIAVAALTRYSSLAALVAGVATPAALLWLSHPSVAQLFMLLTAILLVTHRENISRLLQGTERKIGAST
jgi:acyl phosphate:glycerol-3-phosphate acyltransferase